MTKFGPSPQKLSKNAILRKIWADGAKFVWVSVSPKKVESVELSHSPEFLLDSKLEAI